jgi:hypothetical protein
MPGRLLVLSAALCLASCASEPYLRMVMDDGEAVYCQPHGGDGAVNCDSDDQYHPVPADGGAVSASSDDSKHDLPLLKVLVSRQNNSISAAAATPAAAIAVSASR